MTSTAWAQSLEVLRIRDFRRFLLSRFFGNLAIQMQVLVISWQVWKLTRDPLALGFIGLSEFVPFVALALWGGHVADRFEKRRIVILTEAAHLVTTGILLALVLMGNQKTLWIYLVIAITGVIRSFLWSATHSYSQMAVPQPIYHRAAAWNSSAWEVSAIAGPALGGIFYAWAGPAAALGMVAALMSVACFFAFCMGPKHPEARVAEEPLLQSLLAGFRFVFSNQVLLGALVLDMFAVLFGGVMAILPMVADALGLGPIGLGWLRAAPAIGAILMALYQTTLPPAENIGRRLFIAVSVFGFCMLVFAFSKSFWFSMALLIAAGMADNVSVIIRHSIVQAFTPDAMRGRVSAINGIFIGSSNELGAFESGLAARVMGLVPSIIFGGFVTLLTVAWVAWKFPKLRRLRGLPPGRNKEVQFSPSTS